MTPKQAIAYFDDRRTIAEICRVTEQAVRQWDKRGFIPYDKQCLLQLESERTPRLSRRKIFARWNDVPAKRAA